MKVKIENELCNGMGHCYKICPEVFRIEGDTYYPQVICDRVPTEAEARCREAIERCPNGAIAFVEQERESSRQRELL